MSRGSARTFGFLALALPPILGSGCGDNIRSERLGPLDLVPITDTNPAADIVEVNLVATLGTTTYVDTGLAEIWGYGDGTKPNGVAIVPGPLIEARVGDTVIVHFTNELPEPTTIHWHGIRVPNGADGTHATQHGIPSGATFDYRFIATDAGTFWYHPHLHSDVQIERGLYGALIVRGGPDVPVSADRAFVLDDVKLDESGKLSDVTDAADLMLGRQGNVVLANGRSRQTITVKNGVRERWRFVNAANGRYFSLRLSGHRFTVIGWDGGVLAEPYSAETILVAPGERYEVLVDLVGVPGNTLALETIYYFRAHGMTYFDPEVVFQIDFLGQAATPGPLPTTWGSPPDLVVDENTRVQTLVLGEQDPATDGEEPRFFINDISFPNVPPIEAKSGDVEIWSIKNDTEMDHPFHLHGMFFKVLDVDGQPPAHDGWKDTVNIKHPNTLRFAVRYGGVGHWMYHCHILEHAERGMMAELVLSPPK